MAAKAISHRYAMSYVDTPLKPIRLSHTAAYRQVGPCRHPVGLREIQLHDILIPVDGRSQGSRTLSWPKSRTGKLLAKRKRNRCNDAHITQQLRPVLTRPAVAGSNLFDDMWARA